MQITIIETDSRETFFHEHGHLMHSLAHSYAGAFKALGFDYDDVYQEVCCGALVALDKYEASSGVKLTTFIVTCVQNRMNGIIRKMNASRRNGGVILSLDQCVDPNGDEALSYHEKDLRGADSFHEDNSDLCDMIYTKTLVDEVVRISMKHLSRMQRKIFVLHLEGKPQADISKALGISQSHVSKQLRMALSEVYRRLQDAGQID